MEADVKGHQLNQPTPEKVTTVDPNLNPPRIPGCHCPSMFLYVLYFYVLSFDVLICNFPLFLFSCHCFAIVVTRSWAVFLNRPLLSTLKHQTLGISWATEVLFLFFGYIIKIGLSRNLVDLVGSVGCLDQLVDSRCSASALSTAFPLCRDAWVNSFVSKWIIFLVFCWHLS